MRVGSPISSRSSLLDPRSSASPAPQSSASRSETLPSRSASLRAISSAVPMATTSPPRTPGPGPKSMMWSAARIVSSSCSTTTTVLPRSRRLGERVEQPFVVARMQADRRLVENVEHADQPAADLPGQANPLRLAAGKRRRGALERQIIEADVLQKAEPAADFLEHFGGDQLLVAFQLELGEEFDRVRHGQRTHFGQRFAAAVCKLRAGRRDLHRAGLRIEPLPRRNRGSGSRSCIFRAAESAARSGWCDICRAVRE